MFYRAVSVRSNGVHDRATHVDAPKLLDRVKGNDFLQQLIPVVTLFILAMLWGTIPRETYLATRRLGEPQRPCVHKRVLDIEIVGIVEDGPNVALCGS